MRKTSQKVILTSFISILILLVLSIFITPSKDIRLAETISNRIELETQLQRIVAESQTPGLALAVVKKDKIIYNKAFGMADEPGNIQATPQTVWRWWSLTKCMTAMAIFKLQEDGLLDINDEVSKYLPFFKIKFPDKANIPTVTIKDLLNHSSGIPDNIPDVMGWLHYEGDPATNQTELLKSVFEKYSTLKFQPGTGSSYSSVGYMILGAIIENASGLEYNEYITSKILKPLAMKNTGFILNDDMKKNMATGSHPFFSIENLILALYNRGDWKRIEKKVEDGRIWYHTFYLDSDPPSGLMGPVEDAAQFVMACLNDGELNGVRVLKKESIQQWLYDGYSNPIKMSDLNPFGDKNYQYGRGWFISTENDETVIRNNGGAPGFGTSFCLYPHKSLGIILMANDMNVNSNEIIRLVSQINW